MRLVFLGSPEAAVPSLNELVRSGHEVKLVVSQPDRRRGRGGTLMASPVKKCAVDLGLEVSDHLDDVTEVGAELGVVVAYGRIVPARVLDVLPMVNVHFSLLPRWRGAAPVERAILAGDKETGVCVMRLEEGLDTGPVLAKSRVEIGDDEDADVLTSRLAALGADLLVRTLAFGLEAGTPQVGEPTYAAKITPDDLRLDWRRSALELDRVIRLGRAWTTVGGRRLRVLRSRPIPYEFEDPPGVLLEPTIVSSGSGALELLEVQPEGRMAISGIEWANGSRLQPGQQLG